MDWKWDVKRVIKFKTRFGSGKRELPFVRWRRLHFGFEEGKYLIFLGNFNFKIFIRSSNAVIELYFRGGT